MRKTFIFECLSGLKKAAHSNNPFEEVTNSMRPLFSALEKFLMKQAMGFAKEVREAAREAIAPKGKFIRPLLVFSAAASGGYSKESVVRRAAIAELTHLSTLIHDDVLDNAQIRRNALTSNEKYGARTAILLGDAIFAHTMLLTFDENDDDLLKKTANCIRTICEGEIRQTLADKDLNVSRKRYYEVAYGKTAALFELSCGLGAMAVKNASKAWIEAAEEAGRQLGIAYQIYDDICDWFMSEKDAGKTLGTDLESGKKTFPLIVLLEKLRKKDAQKLSKELLSGSGDYCEISQQMRELGVPRECEREFSRRVSLAEKTLAKHPEEGAKLREFCAAMRKLNVG